MIGLHLTSVPYKDTSLLTTRAVSIALIIALNVATSNTPIITHVIVRARPGTDLATRSPHLQRDILASVKLLNVKKNRWTWTRPYVTENKWTRTRPYVKFVFTFFAACGWIFLDHVSGSVLKKL